MYFRYLVGYSFDPAYGIQAFAWGDTAFMVNHEYKYCKLVSMDTDLVILKSPSAIETENG